MKTVESIISEAWPGWRLESLIGAGAFGEVYRASRQDAAGTLTAAVKVIRLHTRQLRSQVSGEAECEAMLERMTERMNREIRLMCTLRGQTNLVSIDDYLITQDEESGIRYILIRMELLRPLLVDLDIHSYGEEQLLKLGMDLCRGLEVCAREHIVHRDIKPENVFINPLGDYKLGDFSVARTLEMTREALTEWDTARIERFTAPEVKNGKLQEAGFEEACRADIYSLGMVLYWIANGQRFPFLPEKQLYTSQDRAEAEARRLRGDPLPQLPKVSPELQAVILRACAFDSRERYGSAGAFREALEQVQRQRTTAGAGDAKVRTSVPEKTERSPAAVRAPRRRLILVAAAVILLAAGLWLGLPVRVPVRYLAEDGSAQVETEAVLRPGSGCELTADGDLVPEGYALADPAALQLYVSLFRQAEPATAEFHVRRISQPEPVTTLQMTEVSYPHRYAIGLPFPFSGTIASDFPLTRITMNLYTGADTFTQDAELSPEPTVFDMKNFGEQALKNLGEGRFWLEMIAEDAAGRKIGFSHDCQASSALPEHVIYPANRSYRTPELKGTLTFEGHTYEVYRLAGGGWNNASAFAQGKSGHLVTFGDKDEFNSVASFCLGLGIKFLNIGAQYENGVWRWVDDTPFTFHPWNPSAPEDGACLYEPTGAMICTSEQEWFFGKATQYEMPYFVLEYEELLH